MNQEKLPTSKLIFGMVPTMCYLFVPTYSLLHGPCCIELPIRGCISKIIGSLQWRQSALMTSPSQKKNKSHIPLYCWWWWTWVEPPSCKIVMLSSWKRTCCHCSAQILGLLCSQYLVELQHGPYGIIFDATHFQSKFWIRVLVVGHIQILLCFHPTSLSHNDGRSNGRLYIWV